jgi:hypothetical protein
LLVWLLVEGISGLELIMATGMAVLLPIHRQQQEALQYLLVLSPGCVVSIAVGNGNIWFRVNGGNWNGSSTANPSTATGGFAVPSTAQYVSAAVSQGDVGPASITINTVAPFVYAPPSGFSAWGGITPTEVYESLTFAPTAPSSPANGNIWFDGTNFFAWVGGNKYKLNMGDGGTQVISLQHSKTRLVRLLLILMDKLSSVSRTRAAMVTT